MELKTMQIAVQLKVNMLYDKAVEKYGIEDRFEKLTIRFDVKGRRAGWAMVCDGTVNFNTYMLQNNFAAFLSDTVPHEVAHIVAGHINPRDRAHGTTWKNVMWFFGSEPNRCHSFACEPKVRNLKRVQFSCKNCGFVYNVTVGKWQRIQKLVNRGGYCTCTQCRSKLGRDLNPVLKTVAVGR
jgi:SprT protein